MTGLTQALADPLADPLADRSRQEAREQADYIAWVGSFALDPVGYFREVLHVETLWDRQADILQACVEPPYKIAVGAGHNVGKSFLMGGLVNWFFDTRGPCIAATTAPKYQSVVDILWKEVRLLRAREPRLPWHFIGPAAPEMRAAPDWWAKGYVASKGESFKGRHVRRMLFVFDEAVGLTDLYFRATKTMFKPGGEHIWIASFNPTDPTTPIYHEVNRPGSDWRTFSLSSLDHPNVRAEVEARRNAGRAA